MNYPKVSIIVPVWYKDDEGYDMTVRSLETLLETDYPDMEIIVVDDCSPHPRQKDLVEEFSGSPIQFYMTPENGGSTAAVNYGIQFATADLIQYQNNDTEFTKPGWLKEQIKMFNNPQVGIAGSFLRYPSGTIQHAGACWRAVDDHSIDHIGQHQEEIKYLEDVPFVTGCGMTVRREILEKNGGGFTEFKGYGWDDIDIQVKAKEWGWMIKIAPFSSFTHYGSFSYKKRRDLASKDNYILNRMRFESIVIEDDETISYFKEHYYID